MSALLLAAAASATVYPRVWGGSASAPPGGVLHGCSGHLFGFSGMDGPTKEDIDFVGVFTPDAYSLRFCALKQEQQLTVTPPGDRASDVVVAATGDTLLVNTTNGALRMAWASDSILAGRAPSGTQLSLKDASSWSNTTGGRQCQTVDARRKSDAGFALCMLADGAGSVWWALSRSSTPEAATSSASEAVCPPSSDSGCDFDLEAVVSARLAPYAGLPDVGSAWQSLLGKAFSVMRVNALSPEGGITQHWSTPDRTPHRWMWLWDSCYHSLAANLLPDSALPNKTKAGGPNLAWEYLRSVLAGAGPEGGIAIERTPDTVGTTVEQTQPPLLAWAVWENYEAARAAGVSEDELTSRLRMAAPILDAYLRWDMRLRGDPTGQTPLLVWTKGTESGMDNSQRFDTGSPDSLLAVDFSVFLAREAGFLARIGKVIGNTSLEAEWSGVEANVTAAIHDKLWDESTGLYMDLRVCPNGVRGCKPGFSAVEAVTGFLPLWIDGIPSGRIDTLIAAINDTSRFGTIVPLPSVSRATSDFSTDMWRGPMWVNTNYMVGLGLMRQNQTDAGLAVIRAAIECVRKYYERYGAIFEFYDADDTHDPRTLLRKGSHSGGVRDYHWSAALSFNMILLLSEKGALV